MAMSYCGIHDERFAYGGVCPHCAPLPYGSPCGPKTWELTMELKIVCHPVELGSRHIVNKLMQASRCRETAELRWEAVRTEIGVVLEVPR